MKLLREAKETTNMLANEEQKEAVEQLKKYKAELEVLKESRRELEESLPDILIYQNDDGTWTRYTRKDNLLELQEKGEVHRSVPFNRYMSKLESLKNKPKDLK